jgi:L-alanine-DL-glutamate epimerase-like enolase superfamily enzyme
MKITDIRTASLQGNHEWILVRVYTDVGLTGLGECYQGGGVETIVRRMKDVLVGEDPHNVDWLFQKMIRATSGHGSMSGAAVNAVSGVELALWDVAGRALNTPIYNLLGGRYRTAIRMYADCGHGHEPTPASWKERARGAVARGFSAIKFDADNIMPSRFIDPHHVGIERGWTQGQQQPLSRPDIERGWTQGQQQPLSRAEIDLIVSLVGAVREEIGPAVDLAVDCHWNYNTRDVITLAKELEPLKLMWLEDPTPPDNTEALKRVTDNSPVPICCGENHYTRHGLREMIVTQAVDIIQPDVPRVGGLLEAKKVADLADIYYIPFAAHNVSSPIATLAAAHVCASIRNFMIMEFHAQDVDWWDELVIGNPAIRDGYITLPDDPGLGLVLNEDVARAHVRADSSFFT